MGAAGIAGVRRGVLPWARRGSRAYAVASCHGRRGDRTRTPWRLAMGAVGTAHVRRGVLPWAPRGSHAYAVAPWRLAMGAVGTAHVRRGALPRTRRVACRARRARQRAPRVPGDTRKDRRPNPATSLAIAEIGGSRGKSGPRRIPP